MVLKLNQSLSSIIDRLAPSSATISGALPLFDRFLSSQSPHLSTSPCTPTTTTTTTPTSRVCCPLSPLPIVTCLALSSFRNSHTHFFTGQNLRISQPDAPPFVCPQISPTTLARPFRKRSDSLAAEPALTLTSDLRLPSDPLPASAALPRLLTSRHHRHHNPPPTPPFTRQSPPTAR